MSQLDIRRHRPSQAPSGVACATTDFAQITSVQNLVAAHQELSRHAGQGRDVFGSSYSDYSQSDEWRVYRELVQSITSGTYEPAPCRTVSVPKRCKPGQSRSEAGTRELQLPAIHDRSLSYAIHRALTPLIEQDLADRSYGFRQQKSLAHLLIQLERDIRRTGYYHFVQDDIRNAFLSVDLDLLQTLLNCYPYSQNLLDLIARVLRGDPNSDLPGLRQGDSFSPTALNVILDHIHDRWLNRWQQPPLWYRYADNLGYLTQSALEAQEIRHRVQLRLNDHKLDLKGADGPPVDLRRNAAVILGFSLRWKDNNLVLSLPENAWSELEDLLDDCLTNHGNGEYRLRGWISAKAPALYRLPGDNHLRRLRNLYEARFHPIDISQLRLWIRRGGNRWKQLRRSHNRRSDAVTVARAPHTPFLATSDSQGCPESLNQDACPF